MACKLITLGKMSFGLQRLSEGRLLHKGPCVVYPSGGPGKISTTDISAISSQMVNLVRACVNFGNSKNEIRCEKNSNFCAGVYLTSTCRSSNLIVNINIVIACINFLSFSLLFH